MADENPKRAAWSNPIEFILTCVGFAVGLGNVWRFPYLAFKNGGGAFLIPYFVCLALIGIPIFYLELAFGQFASLGPLKIWRMNPAFKGLGFSMVVISALISLYYNVVIAWCIYYFFASLTSHLPWRNCDNEWNTCNCDDKTKNFTLDDPWNGTRLECLNYNYSDKRNSSSEEYYNYRVLDISEGWDHPGSIKWDVTLCNLLAWTIVFLVLSKGIKSLGKVVYFTAIFPYILLTVLLVHGLTLEGHYEGIKFYLSPNITKLSEASVWSDAAVQIFFSLSTCSGGLVAMASYNNFNNNILRDSFIVPIINCFTSFYAGFVIFAVLGFMAHAKGVPIDKVAKDGPGLAFVVYPEGLAQMPVAPLWSALFFFMMVILGFSSQFSNVETIITGLMDEFPVFNKTKWTRIGFRAMICSIGFLLGLGMTTNGGEYMLAIVDHFVGGFPLLFVGFFELIAINYVYGFWRFKRDIEMMLGTGICVNACFMYFGSCWLLLSPLALLTVIITTATQTVPYKDGSYEYPTAGEAVGWLIVLAPLIWIPVWFVIYTCKKGVWKLCVNLNEPSPAWGPSKPENRTGRYSRQQTEKISIPMNGEMRNNDYEVEKADIPNGNDVITSDMSNSTFINKAFTKDDENLTKF